MRTVPSRSPTNRGSGGLKSTSSLFTFFLGFFSAIVVLRVFGGYPANDATTTLNSPIPADVQKALTTGKQSKFKGTQYWKKGFTQKAITLYETPFARFQLHQVQLEDGKTVIDDWMWYDEGDNINIVVETLKGTYLVFEQTKYGLNGQSYAVVGGIIEPGEQPLAAAKRELTEELGMQALQWKRLGAYRAAANRGGGITYPYLARKATPIEGLEQKSSTTTGMAEGEAERQKLLELSWEDLYAALMEGKFQEIKWAATVALALLGNDNHRHHEDYPDAHDEEEDAEGT